MKKSRKKHPLGINGMHHVSLRVRDMKRSLAFYRDILDFSAKTSFLLDGLRFAMLENRQ
jgi:catechol 2,3-dioxygenase-like lactoylglutathione lyase family enzyme